MPQPIESLDRLTLERRYRRMRLATILLSIASVLLLVVLGTQGVGRGGTQGSTSNQSGDPAATQQNANADAQAQAEQCPVVDRRDANDPRALGDIDAPLVLHEWTDFRCPYCGAFSRDTLPILIDEYVKTGKVRLEIHDAALVGGENSVLIAAAARAAGEQGRYFEYYDAVYLEMELQGEGRAEYDRELLVRLADDAGIPDIAAFTEAIESGKFEDDVRADTAEAQQLGISGVPFFATSECTQVLSGAQPVDTFRAALDAAVSAAGQ